MLFVTIPIGYSKQLLGQVVIFRMHKVPFLSLHLSLQYPIGIVCLTPCCLLISQSKVDPVRVMQVPDLKTIKRSCLDLFKLQKDLKITIL